MIVLASWLVVFLIEIILYSDYKKITQKDQKSPFSRMCGMIYVSLNLP
jgi:hypothetical protein